jgi:hypothetical protein
MYFHAKQRRLYLSQTFVTAQMMIKAFHALQQNRCRWDVQCSGMSTNVGWDKIIPFVPGWGSLQAGCQFSVLQAGWQFSVSAKVSFIRAVALVCWLLAITPSSSLSSACEVPPFVLLVVHGVSFCRCRWDVQCSGMSMNVRWDIITPSSLGWACCIRGGSILFLPKSRSLGQWLSFVEFWLLLLPPTSLLTLRSLLLFCWWCSASLSDGACEMFGVLGCPWMSSEKKLSPSSLDGARCRWGGNFLFLPKSQVEDSNCSFKFHK